MGTEISLDIAGLQLVGSKNAMGVDHGPLFQEADRKRVRSEQIDYAYFDEQGEDPANMEMCFERALGGLASRLDLLGYSLQSARAAYENAIANLAQDVEEGSDASLPSDPLSFEDFCKLVCRYPLRNLDNTFVAHYTNGFPPMAGALARDAQAQRLPVSGQVELYAYSDRSYFVGMLSSIFDGYPYLVLRILALCEQNLEEPVTWQYGPLVEAGWAAAGEFVADARRHQRVLVVTEGSSDAHILERAIALLRPEIADFFRFIDMTTGHPFAGSGNLLKFAEGLIKIDVQNQIVFLFDNDAEGVIAGHKLAAMSMPSNMCTLVLPDLDDFKAFTARGPSGVASVDINARAASIECYLDLDLKDHTRPVVIWTNYKKEVDAYQGALENKERYTRRFLAQTPASIAAGSYDVRKLQVLLDALISECINLASHGWLTKAEPPPISEY